MGWGVFQWKCWSWALMALSGVLHRGCNRGVHTFIKNNPESWKNRTNQGWRWEKQNTSNPGSPHTVLPQYACICPSLHRASLACSPLLASPPCWLLPVQFQLSGLHSWPISPSCQGLRAESALCLLLHAPEERQSQAGHKYHCTAPGSGWEAIKSASTSNHSEGT